MRSSANIFRQESSRNKIKKDLTKTPIQYGRENKSGDSFGQFVIWITEPLVLFSETVAINSAGTSSSTYDMLTPTPKNFSARKQKTPAFG